MRHVPILADTDSMRLVPILADTDIDDQRHLQRGDTLHDAPDPLGGGISGIGLDLEHQLIVHLHDRKSGTYQDKITTGSKRRAARSRSDERALPQPERRLGASPELDRMWDVSPSRVGLN